MIAVVPYNSYYVSEEAYKYNPVVKYLITIGGLSVCYGHRYQVYNLNISVLYPTLERFMDDEDEGFQTTIVRLMKIKPQHNITSLNRRLDLEL